ncbi:hypothetical protein K2X33_13375 [bacterium]|nr:hypothetical protein [bacterium]
MKKLNPLKVAAILALIALVPQVSFAEDEAASQAAAELVAGTADFKPGASSEETLAAMKKYYDGKFTKSEQERKTRGEVGAARAAIDANQQKIDTLNAIVPERLKNEEDQQKALAATAQTAMSTPVQSISQQQVDNSGDQEACKVDLSALKKDSDNILSQPFTFAAQNMATLFAKEGDKAGDEAMAAFLKLAQEADAHAKEQRRKQQEEKEEDEFQSALSSASQSKQSKALEDARRLGRLEKKKQDLLKEQESSDEKLNQALIQMVQASREATNKKAKAQAKLLATTGPALDNLEQSRQKFYNDAIAADNEKYEKCKALAKQVGRDQPGDPSSLIARVVKSVTALHQGFKDYYATGLGQRLEQEARGNQCQKNTAAIDAALGSTAQARIQTMRQQTDGQLVLQMFIAERNTLMNSASTVASAIGQNNRSRVACNNLAVMAQKAEKMVKSNTKLASEMALQGSNSQVGGLRPQPNAIAGSAPHIGTAPRI